MTNHIKSNSNNVKWLDCSSAEDAVQKMIVGLGGNPDKSDKQCYCPTHDADKPMLTIKIGHEKNVPMVKCWGGCDQSTIIAELKRRGLWWVKPKYNPYPYEAKVEPGLTQQDLVKHKRAHKAQLILRTAKRNPEKLAAYFKGRGLDQVPEAALYLTRSEARRLTGKLFPAFTCPVTLPNGKGAHVSLLSADRTTNLRSNDGKSQRLSYGEITGGYIE